MVQQELLACESRPAPADGRADLLAPGVRRAVQMLLGRSATLYEFEAVAECQASRSLLREIAKRLGYRLIETRPRGQDWRYQMVDES